jgi:hypothetical protein
LLFWMEVKEISGLRPRMAGCGKPTPLQEQPSAAEYKSCWIRRFWFAKRAVAGIVRHCGLGRV